MMSERRAAASSLSDWDIDWGDVWDAISDTVSDVTEVIVSTVVDPVTKLVTEIQAQVNLIIDGVKRVFEATIDFVEQGFEMAAGIFAKIEVWWEELKEWFGYLFGWPDIARTAEVLSHIFTVGLGFMGGTVGHVRNAVDDRIEALSQFIHTQMDTFINSFAGKQTFGSFVHSSKPSVPAFDEHATNNPLLDHFLANYPGAKPLPKASRARNRRDRPGAAEAARRAEGARRQVQEPGRQQGPAGGDPVFHRNRAKS